MYGLIYCIPFVLDFASGDGDGEEGRDGDDRSVFSSCTSITHTGARRLPFWGVLSDIFQLLSPVVIFYLFLFRELVA